ncbi:sensor histidine kinase [Microbacterium sediminis]|uniref:sensor histidine kinase n=1 Tax=Microbacterium sediminis TaxID=904291 RepID=UPI0009FBA13B|nr:histidine kinase [Microbacterium sediminis]QBR75234.1 sensor histidine kinase [Microbacterium sediminis]
MTAVSDAPARPRELGPSTPLRHPVTPRELRLDAILAAVMFVAAIVSGALSSISQFYGDETADLVWTIPLAVFTTLPLALRRRFPVTVAVVICAAYFVGVELRVPEAFVSNVAMFIAIHTIGAWLDDRRRAFRARTIIVVAMFLWMLVSTFRSVTTAAEDSPELTAGAFSPMLAYLLIQWLINVAYFGGAWFLGDHAYRAALDRQALRDLTARLEEEREISAAQAVALDRIRIARELHDVVGHHVSVMGVQAGAARTVLATDPRAAEQMLRGVEDAARAAIDELHQLLGTLRPHEDEGETPASALRLEGLAELARAMTAAGTPTAFDVVGEPRPVPDLVHVNLYRIAQEALTNARRHGGPDVTAEIRLRYEPDAVELEVTNTGWVRAGARPGIGQLGMRERATAVGGTLELGPRHTLGSTERTGYLVRVRVPIVGGAA